MSEGRPSHGSKTSAGEAGARRRTRRAASAPTSGCTRARSRRARRRPGEAQYRRRTKRSERALAAPMASRRRPRRSRLASLRDQLVALEDLFDRPHQRRASHSVHRDVVDAEGEPRERADRRFAVDDDHDVSHSPGRENGVRVEPPRHADVRVRIAAHLEGAGAPAPRRERRVPALPAASAAENPKGTQRTSRRSRSSSPARRRPLLRRPRRGPGAASGRHRRGRRERSCRGPTSSARCRRASSSAARRTRSGRGPDCARARAPRRERRGARTSRRSPPRGAGAARPWPASCRPCSGRDRPAR